LPLTARAGLGGYHAGPTVRVVFDPVCCDMRAVFSGVDFNRNGEKLAQILILSP
jgi:hypothetical protein